MYDPAGTRTPQSCKHATCNCLIREIMPAINRPPVGIGNDQEHYKVIEKSNLKMTKAEILPKCMFLSP